MALFFIKERIKIEQLLLSLSTVTVIICVLVIYITIIRALPKQYKKPDPAACVCCGKASSYNRELPYLGEKKFCIECSKHIDIEV